MTGRLVGRLTILLVLIMLGAYAPKVSASLNPCAGNSDGCRVAGLSGCCGNSCDCSDTDPTVCTCTCC
jgi:hypothetical protein